MTPSRRESPLDTRIRETLRGCGLRCTPARETVLRRLSEHGHPLAHSELARARDIAALDRVTLYRTLSALQDAGLVHRVQDQQGAWRFCAHVRLEQGCPGNHAHFQCTGCGRMSCLTDQPLPWVSVSGAAEVLGKQFLVYGRCAECGPSARRRG